MKENSVGEKADTMGNPIRFSWARNFVPIVSHSQFDEKNARHKALIFKNLCRAFSCLAERTGFEPAGQFPDHGFSKPALSTTQPPLRGGYCLTEYLNIAPSESFCNDGLSNVLHRG